MEAKQYTISEAAKKLHVGSHVLRFWEEGLHLNIPRNEMGHRIYSEKEMKQLEQIINMKKDGFSLKDIEHKLSPKSSGQVIPYPVSESEISPNDKMIQFKTILSRIVSDAIRENSDSLTSDIADTVSVQVNKELDYLFREKEESFLTPLMFNCCRLLLFLDNLFDNQHNKHNTYNYVSKDNNSRTTYCANA